MEMNYASNGKANAALTTGIIGTAGTALNWLSNGGLSNIFGMKTNCGCSENTLVTRYDSGLQARIAQLEQKNALLEAENFTNTKFSDLNMIYNERFRVIEAQLAQQAVTNAQIGANISCTQQSLADLAAKVDGFTKTIIPITNICPQPAVATTQVAG